MDSDRKSRSLLDRFFGKKQTYIVRHVLVLVVIRKIYYIRESRQLSASYKDDSFLANPVDPKEP